MFTHRPIWLALSVILATTVTACGGDTASSRCEQPVREELDPAHLTHVIDASTARFLTDPPTSGPHVSGGLPVGAIDEAILPAVQVAILERGDVLVQYRDVDDADVAEIRGLAADDVVVAPNPDLPAPVVATAWTYKLTCDALDGAAVQRFIGDHAGNEIAH